MSKEIVARALVQVTVEISLDQPWSGDEPIRVIYERAGRDARERVAALLTGVATALARVNECKIVGEPKVTGVLTERKP